MKNTMNFFRILPLLLLLTACKPASQSPPPASPPLRIAKTYWPGQFWVDVAFDQGWFKAAGLDAVGVDANADYLGSLQQVVDGKLDCQSFVLYDLIRYNLHGADLVMVLTSDYSAGADGIGARPGIERLADLKGRKLGLPKGTYTEFLVNLILAREGFQAGEVELVDMQAEKAVTTLTGGTVDAVATFEPFLGEAIAATKGRLLWDSRQLAGLIPSGITFRRQFLSERPGDVQKLVAVWQRASTFIAEHPDEAYAIVARLNKVTPAEARAMAAKDHLLDLQGNLTAFSYAAGFDSLHGTARVMNDFLIKQNLATNRLDSATFLDARFLKALKSYDSAP